MSLNVSHSHHCTACGYTWECKVKMRKDGKDCRLKIETAAKANGYGPLCNLCLHLKMAERYAAHRRLNLSYSITQLLAAPPSGDSDAGGSPSPAAAGPQPEASTPKP